MPPRVYDPSGTHPNRVRELRDKKGMTRVELADAAGFHWLTVYRHEFGRIRLTLDAAKKYAKALDVEIVDLYCHMPTEEPPGTMEGKNRA